MNCSKCYKNEPKYFFRCLVLEDPKDVWLCEECFQKMSHGEEALAILGSEIVFHGKSRNSNVVQTSNKELVCEFCGTGLNEVGTTGRFGCEKCYETFSDLLAIAEAKIESSKKRSEEKLEPPSKLNSLEEKMRRSVKMEDYEEAAKIRDEISKLKEIKNDGKN